MLANVVAVDPTAKPSPHKLEVRVLYSAPSELFQDESGSGGGLKISVRQAQATDKCLVFANFDSPGRPSVQNMCFSKIGESVRYEGTDAYQITLNAIDPSGRYAEFLVDSSRPERSPDGGTDYRMLAFIIGAITLLFLMAVVGAGVFLNKTVPDQFKFPLVAVIAVGAGLAGGFFVGNAAASGNIPFFGQHPLAVSTTGGIAIMLIVFCIGHYSYLRVPSKRDKAPPAN